MKKTTILCGVLFSGFLLTVASAQESRSDLLKEKERILKVEDSLKKQKTAAGLGTVESKKDEFQPLKELVRLSKTPESKIKAQEDLLALVTKKEGDVAALFKSGQASYMDVLDTRLELLTARADLLVMRGEASTEAARAEIRAEVEKLRKKMEDIYKQRMDGGVVSMEEYLRTKVKFAELQRDLSQTKEDRIKYQKELVKLWGQLETAMKELIKGGFTSYSADVKLALVEAKLKLLDLEEGK